ncbi:MAG TPA: proton-conducting transporter membrane subunit [Anaerolineales bacterium]
MSSALLWIGLPVLLGVALLLYRRQDALPLFVAASVSLLLSWAAWQIPIDVVLQFGPVSLEITPSFLLFGRSFTLSDAQAPLLAFIYLVEAIWILGTKLAKPGPLFIPINLICIGLLVAALAVEPFLYAALLIALAAMLQIPLLAPAGTQGPGVLRFLKFQIFAVPFILFTGWILSGVEASPGNLDLVARAGLLLALGFAFLLALFPFHSWLPMLGMESHPYVVGFLAFFLPSIGLIFGLGFFDRYSWLRDSSQTYLVLLLAGGLTALLGGLWAARERHLGRMLAYATMLCTGLGLQALGLGVHSSQVFFALLLPQALAIWGWAVALSMLYRPEKTGLEIEGLQTQTQSRPLALLVLLVAVFSVAGLPLLGCFPGRVALLDGVAAASPWAAAASLIGSLGLLAGGLRLVHGALASSAAKTSHWVEEVETAPAPGQANDLSDPYMWVFSAVVILSLLGFGLIPRVFLSAVPDLAGMFSQLAP